MKSRRSCRLFFSVFCIVLLVLILLSACSLDNVKKAELPEISKSQGEDELEPSAPSLIPGTDLEVNGTYSLCGSLGKHAAGSAAGLYFILRGKLFFWDYSKNYLLSLRTSIHETANIIFSGTMRIGQASRGRLFCGKDIFPPVLLSFITIAYTTLRKPAAAAVKPLISL